MNWVKPIALIVALVLAGLLAVVARHYNDAYSVRLPTPSGYTRIAPRHFDEKLTAEVALYARDWVGRVGEEGLEVVASSHLEPPWSGLDTATLLEAALTELKRRGRSPRECEGRQSGDVRWDCVEWSSVEQGLPFVQRSYITMRGNSVWAIVFLAAPPDRFSAFGSPGWWLDNTEWRGPSIAYSF